MFCPINKCGRSGARLADRILSCMLFLAGRIGNCAAEDYIRPALTLMWVGMLPVLLLTTYWPGLCLFVPRLAGYVY